MTPQDSKSQEAPPSLFFATPCYRSDPKLAQAWAQTMITELNFKSAVVSNTISCFLNLSQAQLVAAFRASRCSYLFMRDDDIFIQPRVLVRMIDAKVPAIVAPYMVRGEGRLDVTVDEYSKVLFAGTGCALIERSVIEKMWNTFFEEEHFYKANDLLLVNLFRNLYVKDSLGRRTELQNDHSFWFRMRQCGITIEALDDVTVNHAGEISHFKK